MYTSHLIYGVSISVSYSLECPFKYPKCLQALCYQQRERRQTVMPVHSVCGFLPLSDGHSAGRPLRDDLAFCTESAQRLGRRNRWWHGRPRKGNTHRRSSVRDHVGLMDSLESSRAGATGAWTPNSSWHMTLGTSPNFSNCHFIFSFKKYEFYFFRAVWGSQQNWEGVRDFSYIPCSSSTHNFPRDQHAPPEWYIC